MVHGGACYGHTSAGSCRAHGEFVPGCGGIPSCASMHTWSRWQNLAMLVSKFCESLRNRSFSKYTGNELLIFARVSAILRKPQSELHQTHVKESHACSYFDIFLVSTTQHRRELVPACASRAEQSRAEQSRAEQSRAEQSRAEQSRGNTALLAVCSEDCRVVERELSAKHVKDWETNAASHWKHDVIPPCIVRIYKKYVVFYKASLILFEKSAILNMRLARGKHSPKKDQTSCSHVRCEPKTHNLRTNRT